MCIWICGYPNLNPRLDDRNGVVLEEVHDVHVAHPPDRRVASVVAPDVLDEVGEEAKDLLVEVAVRRPEGGRRLGPRLSVAVVAAVEAETRRTSFV